MVVRKNLVVTVYIAILPGYPHREHPSPLGGFSLFIPSTSQTSGFMVAKPPLTESIRNAVVMANVLFLRTVYLSRNVEMVTALRFFTVAALDTRRCLWFSFGGFLFISNEICCERWGIK